MVEGYTDVAMTHQHGVENVVSVLGTALTVEHVSLLRRFADRVVLLFDADNAGAAATDRSVELYLTQPVEIRIATMPSGVDPDEFLREHGREGFEARLAEAEDPLAYQWRRMRTQFDERGDDLTGRQRAVEQYLQTLADARGAGPVDPLRWGAVLARVSKLTDISIDDLQRRFNRPAAARANGADRPPIDGPNGSGRSFPSAQQRRANVNQFAARGNGPNGKQGRPRKPWEKGPAEPTGPRMAE